MKSVEKTIVRIGDWAIFKTEDDCPLQNLFLLGRVLSFSILQWNKKEVEKRILEWDPSGEGVNLGVLCIWYEIVWDTISEEQCAIKDIMHSLLPRFPPLQKIYLQYSSTYC